jgi:3-hydroxyisobutyrate dehydrogenase
MATIAFIGLGNMGGPMAANLVKAGHKVIAFDLVAASRDQAKADGAAIAESSVAAVKGADTVITMLPAGKHVISVWNEVVPSMTKGALIIDCSTIDVEARAGKHGQADRALRRRRRRAGGEDLQQHDIGRFHDRGRRSLCARRKA